MVTELTEVPLLVRIEVTGVSSIVVNWFTEDVSKVQALPPSSRNLMGIVSTVTLPESSRVEPV
jgi:hypothetical protein